MNFTTFIGLTFVLCTSWSQSVQSLPTTSYEARGLASDQQGPTLVNTWKFHQHDLQSSYSMRGKGAVFSFPEKCSNTKVDSKNSSDASDDDDEGDEGSQISPTCTQQMIEKSVVLREVPRHLIMGGNGGDDDDNDNSDPIQFGVHKVHKIPKKCVILNDGTTWCEERIVTEYYLPTEEAHQELEKALHLSPNNPFYQEDTGIAVDAKDSSDGGDDRCDSDKEGCQRRPQHERKQDEAALEDEDEEQQSKYLK